MDFKTAVLLTHRGIMFGYPICCILDFVEQWDARWAETAPHRNGPWVGTGFVPCTVCAEMIKVIGLEAYVEAIITPKRIVEQEFPHGRIID